MKNKRTFLLFIFSLFFFLSCSFETAASAKKAQVNLADNDSSLISDSDTQADRDSFLIDEDSPSVDLEDIDIATENESDSIVSDKDKIIVDEELIDDDFVAEPDLNNDSEPLIDSDSKLDADIKSDDDSQIDSDSVVDETPIPDVDNIVSEHGEIPIRIMAANITSGNAQAYETPGINIFKAFDPDIVLIQEFNYESGTTRDLVDIAFGEDFYFSEGKGNIPNGIISRFPILDDGYWDDPYISDRDLNYAIVDIPGNRDIFAISVHLHTSPSSDQVEAAQIIANNVYELKKQHPGKYYYVVGGDFNGPASVDSSGFGTNSSFYINGPHPVGEDGLAGTNASRAKVYDWILPDSDLHNFMVTVNCGNFSYPNGLVFDSRDFSQAELDKNFPPVKTGDSGATNMQHMAIIKDFVVKY